MKFKIHFAIFILSVLVILLSMYSSLLMASNASIKVYSERQPFLIQPLIDEYEKVSGNKIEWIYSKKGLVQKAILEKNNPIADVFLSSDIARLVDLTEAGANYEMPYQSNAPSNAQSKYWTGLTMRARIIYAHNDLGLSEISYEDLVLPQYKGRVCSRTGFHPYNISLFSALVAHHGEEWFEDYIIKLKNNLARRPQGNDRDQVKAIAAGQGDVAIVNSYYIGLLLSSENEEEVNAGKSISVFFPNQGEGQRGSHINVSGVALAKNAPNKSNALKLIEYLTSDEAQEIYVNNTYEYSVKPNIEPNDIVKEWGTFKKDPLDLNMLGIRRNDAIRIFDAGGWK